MSCTIDIWRPIFRFHQRKAVTVNPYESFNAARGSIKQSIFSWCLKYRHKLGIWYAKNSPPSTWLTNMNHWLVSTQKKTLKKQNKSGPTHDLLFQHSADLFFALTSYLRLWTEKKKYSGSLHGFMATVENDTRFVIWKWYCWWFRNPANPSMGSLAVFIPLFTRFCTSQLVQDFFHQQ